MTLSTDNNSKEESIPCKFCNFVDLPSECENIERKNSRSTRSKGTTSDKRIDTTTKWVYCSSCEQWLHPSCNGLNEKEFVKISKLLDTDDEFQFKCIECCISVSVQNAKKSRDIIEVFKTQLSSRIKKGATPITQSVVEKKKKRKTSTQSESQGSPNKAVVCDQNTVKDGTHDVLVSEERKAKETTDSALEVSDVDECAEDVEQLNITSEKVNNRNKIIVIDDIPNSMIYVDSRKIFKEINSHCPQFKIVYAYRLSKGGVAIHLHSEEDRDRLFDLLPSQAFGGGLKKKLDVSKWYQIFVKNVDHNIDLAELERNLINRNFVVKSITRIVDFKFGKPTKVLKIETDLESCEKFVSKSFIVINNIRCPIEKRKFEPVVRCFGCQSFGHIRKNCQLQLRCERCGGPHDKNNCQQEEKCVNCNGNHSASSKLCEAYISKYECLTGEHPIHQHVEISSSGSSRQALS